MTHELELSWTEMASRTFLWCSAVQCGAVCCRVLQSQETKNGVKNPLVLQCAAARCSVLQCAAVCCNLLQRVAVCCSLKKWKWRQESSWNVAWLPSMNAPALLRAPWYVYTHTHTHTHTHIHWYQHTATHFNGATHCCFLTVFASSLLQGGNDGLPCGAVQCSVLQCVAVCGSVLHCVAVCCGVIIQHCRAARKWRVDLSGRNSVTNCQWRHELSCQMASRTVLSWLVMTLG